MAKNTNKKKVAKKAKTRKKTAKKKTAKKTAPSTKGDKGISTRGADGRFLPGHKEGGPGNPHAKAVSTLRAALLAAVTQDDVEAVVKKLVDQAKDGNIVAARELLDRLFGKSNQPHQVAVEETKKSPDKMTDLELAAALAESGQNVPRILAAKIQRIREADAKAGN